MELGHGADIKQSLGVPWTLLHRSIDGQGGAQGVGLGFPKREMGEQTRKSPQSQNSLGVTEAKNGGIIKKSESLIPQLLGCSQSKK